MCSATLIRVRWCEVVFRGKDGELHTYMINAASKYDAAAKGIQEVAQFWWYDPELPLIIRPLEPRRNTASR
jgi:hypothetical protein